MSGHASFDTVHQLVLGRLGVCGVNTCTRIGRFCIGSLRGFRSLVWVEAGCYSTREPPVTIITLLSTRNMIYLDVAL